MAAPPITTREKSSLEMGRLSRSRAKQREVQAAANPVEGLGGAAAAEVSALLTWVWGKDS